MTSNPYHWSLSLCHLPRFGGKAIGLAHFVLQSLSLSVCVGREHNWTLPPLIRWWASQACDTSRRPPRSAHIAQRYDPKRTSHHRPVLAVPTISFVAAGQRALPLLFRVLRRRRPKCASFRWIRFLRAACPYWRSPKLMR